MQPYESARRGNETNFIRQVKPKIRSVLGDELVGRLDYYRFRNWRDSWGGPFNGQQRRRELFVTVADALKPRAIVETGTYRGTTTALFAQTGLPVYTVEAQSRNFGFAKEQLRGYRNVKMLRCDSREGLRRILGSALQHKLHEPLFFYPDAHWDSNLPLAEELDIIFSKCERAVVMIDDFQVPSDDGYDFDSYGPGSTLTQDYIAPHLARYALVSLYPKAAAREETGARRGCVVLANKRDSVIIQNSGLTCLGQ